MASLFRKLIQSELGIQSYEHYFRCYQNSLPKQEEGGKIAYNKEVFQDIYEKLKDQDIVSIERRSTRLMDTMLYAMRINRMYLPEFVFYLAVSLFLISQMLPVGITLVSLGLISLCFLFKSYEFIENKYCYIDAHIILVYKEVLEELMLRKQVSK
ncbi:MAG: hypothetical protein PUB10_08895 [Clostridiales bacterium]|nr:hypothetical protein [Clostridiales bacterium]